MNQFNEKSYEAHYTKSNSCGDGNFLEFCKRRNILVSYFLNEKNFLTIKVYHKLNNVFFLLRLNCQCKRLIGTETFRTILSAIMPINA